MSRAFKRRGGQRRNGMSKKIVSGKSRTKRAESAAPRRGMPSNFLKVLNDDFEAYGRDVIASMRINEPSAYLRLAASVLPKDMVAKRPVEELSDEALHSLIEAARRPDTGMPISAKRSRLRTRSAKSVG